jgi:hypothetical protein
MKVARTSAAPKSFPIAGRAVDIDVESRKLRNMLIIKQENTITSLRNGNRDVWSCRSFSDMACAVWRASLAGSVAFLIREFDDKVKDDMNCKEKLTAGVYY